MSFEHELYDNKCVVVRPTITRLDSIAAPEFRQYVTSLAEEHKMQVVVDLAAVDFMDSSGLGAVIGCYKAVQGSGGMAICNVHENVKEVFQLTHMDRIFEIHDNFDACLKKNAA